MTYEIITVSSHRPTQPYYCYDEFFRSLAQYGKQATILGQNPGEYWGLGAKPQLLLEYLSAGRTNTELVLFTDCWDVLFLHSPDAAINRFLKRFDADVVFNAEKSMFPACVDESFFPDTGTPYRFLNSGFFIGYRDKVIEMLLSLGMEKAERDHKRPDGTYFHTNDQGWLLQAFTKQPVRMALDSQAELCLTTHGATDEDASVSDNDVCSVCCRHTGVYPVAIHGNGGGKESPPFQRAVQLFRQHNP